MSSDSDTDYLDEIVIPPREPLKTKRAVELLLGGKLKANVCKYCLTVTSSLTDLDQFLKVTGEDGFYKVTIKDMVANFYPYQVHADENLPDKVCEVCLNRIVSCYLFIQQCERSERAIKNCFEEVFEKLDKLDPVNRVHTRGRPKLNPNTNKLFVSYKQVLDYADPLISLVNQGTTMEHLEHKKVSDLECPRCWQLFNNIEELLNHEKSHPRTMWFYCRMCGLSFAKENYYRKHLNTAHEYQNKSLNLNNSFKCRECGIISDDYQSQLQHNEKHKFKDVMAAVLDKQMDKLCTICLEKGNKMVNLDSTVRFHGGHPRVSGDHSLYNVVGSSLPNHKSRHKFQELLVSSAAKVLRMKRKSDMIDDTLNSTMSGSIVDNYNQSISYHTISSQNTSSLKEKSINDSLTNNHSKDAHSEFVFSMPLIIPAKRPKLDLETPKRTISRESLQTRRQFYNRPNYFMFKYALNQKLNQSKLNRSEDHLPKNKEPDSNEIEIEMKSKETLVPIEKKDHIIPLKDNKKIDPLQQNNQNMCILKEGITNKNIVPLQASNNNLCIVKESNIDTIDLNVKSNEDTTKQLINVNKINSKASNEKVVQASTDEMAEYMFIFTKALNIRKNIAPSLLNLIEQELLKLPTDTSLNNFAFSKPIECWRNCKEQICDKSSQDINQAIDLNEDEGIRLTGSINKFKTSSETIGNNNDIEVGDGISKINSKCGHCGPSDKTQEVCMRCNDTGGNTLPDIVNMEKVIDIQHNTDNNKNKSILGRNLGKNIYPAILTDSIKVLNYNIERVDKNNDIPKSYNTTLTRGTNKEKEKIDSVKTDILKESDDKDNVIAPKTENAMETISRKRKTTDETFVLETTDWECTYCFTKNYSYRISCFCCESVRDIYKPNINIDFGSSKKRRLYEKNKEEQAEDRKNEENNTKDSKEEQEKSRIIFPIPKLQEQATPIKIVTTETSTTKVVTTETVATTTTASETAKTEANILPKPILPFNSSVTGILQFAKPDVVEKKKDENIVDIVDTPKLILHPTNVETTGTSNEKNIKKTVKFEDSLKTFKIPFKIDTTEKPIFQFGKTAETKKEITTPQVPAEQKFGATPNLSEAKPPVTQVLDDIDMAEITENNAGFNTSSSSVVPQASIIGTLFPTPNALTKSFEQKDTTNTFKGFGNFGTPLTTFAENKTFETPAATPFTFNNNLNFNIGAGSMENKGNANANRKAENRRIRTARRRCT